MLVIGNRLGVHRLIRSSRISTDVCLLCLLLVWLGLPITKLLPPICSEFDKWTSSAGWNLWFWRTQHSASYPLDVEELKLIFKDSLHQFLVRIRARPKTTLPKFAGEKSPNKPGKRAPGRISNSGVCLALVLFSLRVATTTKPRMSCRKLGDHYATDGAYIDGLTNANNVTLATENGEKRSRFQPFTWWW